ncbi:ABC-2 transporter permease [Spiroplasma culicicola]|uniref:Uncharacterized protein n=1 Tax=Spiroplasma culicicola AES-1 TaxID=1276246 RepID=W6A683_9MOLU|nr:ABC transporter permease [Spiroplasma culicicola]AHI52461.1 hypothetical protein SCULI_v1c01200 [Spiroplasma culicicola AES-1]
MENNQNPIQTSTVKLNLQKPVKVKKQKEPRQKGEKFIKPIKFEGIWLLLWVNVKKAFTTKTIIAMGIVFLIISFIFTSISLPMIASGDEVGKIISWIGYILTMFFYIIFLSLLAIILVKTPILEGITQIEIRAGVAIWKSYLIRFATYLLIAFAYCLVNMIIVFSYLPLAQNLKYLRMAFIISPPIFLFIFAIIWYPLITFIALICSQAMGIFTNIFVGAVVAVVPIINAVIPVFMGDFGEKNKDIQVKTVQLQLANDFYQSTINDENVKGIYEEDILSQINKNIDQINKQHNTTTEDNICVIRTLDLNSLITYDQTSEGNPSGCSSASNYLEYLERAFYLGEFNTNTTTNTEITNVFDNLYISQILSAMFDLVDEKLYEVPVGHPGFNEAGIYYASSSQSWYDNSRSTNYIDISVLVKWLAKQLPEYKNLLTTIEKQYNKYKEIMWDYNSINDNYYLYSGKSYSYMKIAQNDFYKGVLELNNDAISVYKRHPELAIINNLIIQNWMNVYALNSSLQQSAWNEDNYGGSWNTTSLTNEEMFEKMQKRTTSQIISKYANPTHHISSMWNGLFGKNVMLDLLVSDSSMEMIPRGVTKGVSNLEEFAQYSTWDYVKSAKASEIDPDRKMVPMFEKVTLKVNFGYNVSLIVFIYVLSSLGVNALVYLTYKKQARI